MAWLSIGLTRFAVGHLGLPYPMVLAPLLWLAIFVGVALDLRTIGPYRLRARRLVFRARFHPSRAAAASKRGSIALPRELVRLVRETDADEIVVDGHSLGAPLSLVVVDRALQLDPQLGAAASRCTWFRPARRCSKWRCIRRPAGCAKPSAGWRMRRSIYWVEYQALVDIINVYKVDPVVALGLPATGKPIVKIIRIRMMVEEHTYRRFHLNFLRIHRQAVMGNERRYFYDYYMLCCGPLALARLGRGSGSGGCGVCRRWRIDRGGSGGGLGRRLCPRARRSLSP